MPGGPHAPQWERAHTLSEAHSIVEHMARGWRRVESTSVAGLAEFPIGAAVEVVRNVTKVARVNDVKVTMVIVRLDID